MYGVFVLDVLFLCFMTTNINPYMITSLLMKGILYYIDFSPNYIDFRQNSITRGINNIVLKDVFEDIR